MRCEKNNRGKDLEDAELYPEKSRYLGSVNEQYTMTNNAQV